MSFEDELKKMGYKFEYAHGEGGDRTEVWLNEDAHTCVRIEWMKIDEEGWRLKGPALQGKGMPSVGRPQRSRHRYDDAATSVAGTRVLP